MLTKKDIQLCIDRWQWYYNHPLKTYEDLPDSLRGGCPLCKKYFNGINFDCGECPIYSIAGSCNDDDSYFHKWFYATTKKTSQKYSGLLLELMKKLKRG